MLRCLRYVPDSTCDNFCIRSEITTSPSRLCAKVIICQYKKHVFASVTYDKLYIQINYMSLRLSWGSDYPIQAWRGPGPTRQGLWLSCLHSFGLGWSAESVVKVFNRWVGILSCICKAPKSGEKRREPWPLTMGSRNIKPLVCKVSKLQFSIRSGTGLGQAIFPLELHLGLVAVSLA